MIGSAVLLVLAGCGRSWLAEREAWRRDAEEQCLKSGAVREGPSVSIVRPITGPGVCGADFPIRVAALGDSRVLGYNDDPRPPGGIPGGRPISRPGYPANTPFSVNPDYPADTRLPPRTGDRALAPDAGLARPGEPISLAPSGLPPAPSRPDSYPSRDPVSRSVRPRAVEPQPGDPIREEALRYGYPSPSAPSVPLSPSRARSATGSISAAEVKPNATLACPIVSALDRWVTDAVQPAALRWFAQPVVELRQISAYSCRGMNGQPGAKISEHAFGNALDIASFKLADGHVITVKGGWRGTPEEQGFLRDVQLAACEQFTTVLAPGSNAFHYDHIHVDLMRRASGRRICQPAAVPGEVVAARARARYAGARRADPGITGSIGDDRNLPRAIPGED